MSGVDSAAQSPDIEFLPGPEPTSAGELPSPTTPIAPFPDAEPLPIRPRRKRRFGPRSLTGRLLTGAVALVLLLVVIVGTVTYFALRSFLLTRLDQQLSSIASSNESAIVRCLSFSRDNCGLNNGPGALQAPVNEWLAVLEPNGTPTPAITVTTADGLNALDLSAGERRAIVGNPGAYRTLDDTSGQQLRIVARATDTSVGQMVVVSGLATDDVHRTLSRLVRIETIVGLGAILLAFVATTAGVRLSLRRLRRVTTTAQEVAAELSPQGAGLDRRVPDDEPETEVGQLATSFNTMLEAVQMQFAARLESEERMRQFLADASHELRTPLTSIRGYAELARMQRAVGDTAEDNLDRIESEGTRMSRLVEDLLLLARGESDGATPPEHVPLDVTELLDDVASGTRAAFPGRQIGVEAGPLPAVYGDHDQLLRVVRNLVTNACVHTDPARPIRLRAYPDGPGVTIQVIDGGPGLPPDQAAHVFERFWRADKARTRARGGSGLGLSIVATIVRNHGGVVRFDSTVEHGSTASVWLPSGPPAYGPPSGPPGRAPAG